VLLLKVNEATLGSVSVVGAVLEVGRGDGGQSRRGPPGADRLHGVAYSSWLRHPPRPEAGVRVLPLSTSTSFIKVRCTGVVSVTACQLRSLGFGTVVVRDS
jgi:hypothetical protein